jgi:hypothetical protein
MKAGRRLLPADAAPLPGARSRESDLQDVEPLLAGLGRSDCLVLTPRADDVGLSCPARLGWEAQRGNRVVVLALFEDPARRPPVADALRGIGIEYLAAGLAPPSRRDPLEAYGGSLGPGSGAAYDEAVDRVAHLLADVDPRVRARHVYAPLGVGGHADHRAIHDAAIRTLGAEAGRNVFFYEERPEAFVPGAVRVRLGLLGARLPPGAVGAADRAGLTRYLLNVHLGPSLRGDVAGISDRLRSTGSFAREWRVSRAWNPQRAFGPRLQPMRHPVGTELLGGLEAVVGAALPAGDRRNAQRFRQLAARYARRLGGEEPSERLWLLLPSERVDGLPLAPAVGE